MKMIHRINRTINNILILFPRDASGRLNRRALHSIFKVSRYIILRIPFFFFAIPLLCIIRIIHPLYLIRIGTLFDRIGPMAGATEVYLCEKDVGLHTPNKGQRYLDLFFLEYCLTGKRSAYNKQLYKMWRRVLPVVPEPLLAPLKFINIFFPGKHMLFNKSYYERDIYNLFDRLPPHLQFTEKEEEYGRKQLQKFGVPPGAPFICLLVRDSAFHENYLIVNNDHLSFRDSDIDNYYLAIQELIQRGYFVIRMGVKVNKPLKVVHTNIIDYAWCGLRSDFMDIYLGAKCNFCITTGTGWDNVPYIFRRPIVYTNYAFLGALFTFCKNSISISKKYKDIRTGESLKLSEIFNRGLGFSMSNYDLQKSETELIENTPEEIRDVVLEMLMRMDNTWIETKEDKKLQTRFWELFPKDVLDHDGRPYHGAIKSRFGASFLRANKYLLS